MLRWVIVLGNRGLIAALLASLAVSPAACAPPPPLPPAAVEVDRWTASAMRQIEVTMFMTDWCPVCQRAQAFLDAHGYRYLPLDVERDQGAAAALSSINPVLSVPTFDIDRQVLVGFEPRQLELALLRAAQRRGGGSGGWAAPRR